MCGAAVSRSASFTCSYGFDPTWSLLRVISLTERPPTSKGWPSLGFTWRHRWARFSLQGITKNSRTTRNTSTRSENSSRSEEHTSELQSLAYLVCRLLLEKKK